MSTPTKKEKYVTYGVFTEALETLTNRLDARFDGIDKRFDGIDKRFDTMASKDDIDRLALAIDKNSHDISILNGIVATKADINDLNNRFDAYAGKFTHMDRQYNIEVDKMRNINETLTEHGRRLTALENPPSPAGS